MVQPCPSLNLTYCIVDTLFYFYSGDLIDMCGNNCPLECDTITYTTSSSSVVFPSDLYASRMINNDYMKSLLGFTSDSNLTINDVRSRMLAVNVHYASLAYQSFSESPKTEVVDLVSSIGGTLGLFLGVSFLSFIEIFDLVVCLLIASTNRMSRVEAIGGSSNPVIKQMKSNSSARNSIIGTNSRLTLTLPNNSLNQTTIA